ncbi:MAG TPA: STAS domain-containing protein [Acidimicrobiales bacterium]|nr:STAS domain-containing protein [Acidimicrobiales bacterium]
MNDPASIAVQVRERDDILQIEVQGELDLLTEPDLVDHVDRALSISGAARVVMELRGVDFIDSSGLRSLLRCRDLVASHDRQLALIVGDGVVRRLLDVAGVSPWFSYA